MAVTALDPRTALVIVDLQRGIAALPLAQPVDAVITKSRLLADAFRKHGLPVALVNVDGGAPGRTEQPRPAGSMPADWAQIVPELDPQPHHIRVTKQTWGAFASTDLEQRLRDIGVTQVVVTGVATSIGVESTAREAYARGFNVTLATDAMTDMRREAHDNSVANIFPRLGETGTTKEILDLVERTFG